MGYEIRYDGADPARRQTGSPGSRLPVLIAAFFLAFLLLTRAFWPAGTEKMRQLLLPGDPEVTSQAVSALVDDLRSGQPVGEAVTVFCKEILAHGEYAD